MKSATRVRVVGIADRRRVRGRVPSASALITLLAVVLTAGVSLTGYVAPASAAECLTIPPGIEAWWPGDGSPDELVHGRDGTLANGAAYTTGQAGQAFTFDGVDDVVSVPDGPVWDLGDSDFTQAMWVKFASTDSGRALFTSHDGAPGPDSSRWFFYWDAGALQISARGPYWWQNIVSADWAPVPGSWYQIGVSRIGDTWTLFVNGAVLGATENAINLPSVSGPVRIGSTPDNEYGSFAMDGALDEVMFFHRGLSATEVKAIYDAGAAGLCDPIATALTMVPSKSMVWNGLPVTLSGALTVDGPVSREGQTITVTRSVNGKPPVTVTEEVTGAEGTYTYTEKPPLGTVQYTAWFEGSGNAVPASAKTTVTVKKGESQVSLSVSDRHLVIGQSAKLSAKLAGGSVNRDVTIWARPVGQAKRVVERGAVGADNVLTTRVEPRLNTTYWATYAGDVSWTPDTSREAGVDVQVKWRDTVNGDYAKSGTYHLFHFETSCANRGANCPSFVWELIPDHGGKFVSLSWQVQRSDGSWTRPYRDGFRLNRASKLEIWYRYVEESIGVNQRVRVEYSGDATHVGAASDWIYWRVTR